jgi:soluble lytic murein transglycosylase-like protein
VPRTRAPARIALLVVTIAVAVIAATVLLARSDTPPKGVPLIPTPPGGHGAAVPDPFAYSAEREADFTRRAAAGNAHLLYALSPGGAAASAARTARWRPLIDRAAHDAGVDPDVLEGLVFLESAGRPDAVTPAGLDGAVGLTQILAETASNLLGMHVDVAASRRATRRIARALRRGHRDRAAALERERARVDQRFDPRAALAATARYLAMARKRFGREDLAFVSYHMGMGNLEGVLRAYSGDPNTPVGQLVADRRLSYARVYFDSSPTHHPGAWRRLFTLGDDSANYLWKLLAARRILGLWRHDPAELTRLALLQRAKNSAEEVLHPASSTPVFADPGRLRAATDHGDIVPFPDRPATTGLRLDGRMGELAQRVGQQPSLYRGLRPEALALALYIGAQVRAQSGGAAPLVVTSTVRDERYQRALASRNVEATHAYSLHTTGWAFDVERRYVSNRQAAAFQFVLDRLQALDVIAWVREPTAIHITAGGDARLLLALLRP